MKKILCLILLLFAGCVSKEDTTIYLLNQSFTLESNHTAIFPQENLSIQLKEMFNSPCPPGAQCFWSGVGVLIKVSKDGDTQELLIQGEPPTSMSAYGYLITLHKTNYISFAELSVSKVT